MNLIREFIFSLGGTKFIATLHANTLLVYLCSISKMSGSECGLAVAGIATSFIGFNVWQKKAELKAESASNEAN